MPKYTFTRCSVFEEYFTVEAASEEEALELVQDGAPGVEIGSDKYWRDWYDEEYTLEDVEDELVRFVRSKWANMTDEERLEKFTQSIKDSYYD